MAAVLGAACLMLPSGALAATCKQPAGAKQLERTRSLLLYRTRHAARTVACWRSSGKTTTLFRDPLDDDLNGYYLNRLQIHRNLVLVEQVLTGRMPSAYRLALYDVRSGSRKWLQDVADLPGPVHGPRASVQEAVIRDGGNVAYTVLNPYSSSSIAQVYAVIGGGRKLLDGGPGVDASSLTSSSGAVQWMNAGTLRTADLP